MLGLFKVLLPECSRAYACCLCKYPCEICIIIYTEAVRDFLYGKAGIDKQTLGLQYQLIPVTSLTTSFR